MAIRGTAPIEHPAQYAAVTRQRIIANAKITFCRTYPDANQIIEWVESFKEYDYSGIISYPANFGGSLSRAFDTYGKLTEGQVNAVRKIMATQAARKAEWASKEAALNANREHIGVVGQKVTITLTVKHIVELESIYGANYIHICEDAFHNVIIYKGKSESFPRKGETATVVATVKEHGVRDGVKQTIIQRPKLAK
jgi:hypothetical protein